MNINIRPLTLEEYVGQKDIKEKLMSFVKVFQKTRQTPYPILLSGSRGLGKTSLARAFAKSMGVEYIEAFGAILRTADDVFNLLKNNGRGISEGAVIFLDECHSIGADAQTILLPIIEDGELVHAGKTWQFPNWTWIFATTNPGMISKPLYDRLTTKCIMDNYTEQELYDIGLLTLRKLNMEMGIKALKKLATLSFGVPRLMNNFIKALNTYYIAYDIVNTPTRYVGIDELPQFLSYYGVNDKGLDKSDISYLKCLYNNVLEGKRLPVGLKVLEKKTKLPQDEIEDNIEPKLIQLNYISFSDKGRFLTEEGLNYVASLM